MSFEGITKDHAPSEDEVREQLTTLEQEEVAQVIVTQYLERKKRVDAIASQLAEGDSLKTLLERLTALEQKNHRSLIRYETHGRAKTKMSMRKKKKDSNKHSMHERHS